MTPTSIKIAQAIPLQTYKKKIITKLLYLGGIYTTLKNYTTFKKSLSTSNNHIYDNNAKPLSISIQSSQNIVNGRGISTVTAIAYDANTDKKIDNAIVKLKISFTSNNTSKEIVGHSGEVSAEIKPNSKENSNIGFRTTVQAFAPTD